MSHTAFRILERTLILHHLTAVENFWPVNDHIDLPTNDSPGFSAITFERTSPEKTLDIFVEHVANTVQIVPYTSHQDNGVWFFQGWIAPDDYQDQPHFSKIALGLYIPSLYGGYLTIMSAEDLELEERERKRRGLHPLSASFYFMQWKPTVGEDPRDLLSRALIRTVPNYRRYRS